MSCDEKKFKGSQCSISGNNYEKCVFEIVNKCILNKKKFNTQKSTDLGGSNCINDIQCNYNDEKDIGIEIKKCKTPDWMQCSIKYNVEEKKWESTKNGKIPKDSAKIFDEIINKISIFENDIPPFMIKKITHEEWIKIKKETKKWNDVYIEIPNDTIQKIYSCKKCQYIQISDYGLYHLGDDVCNFDVPEFTIEQQMRIRIKIHTKKDKDGFCKMSVMAACKPKNIKLLEKSKYTLDNKDKLPKNLTHQDKQ